MTAAVTAVVCTRNRAALLGPTLDALEAQRDLPVLVVDQSDAADPALDARPLRVLRDAGRGLSRARNLAVAEVQTPWVVFVDDDCLVGPTFADDLRAVLAAHPEAAFVAPHVDAPVDPAADGLQATAFAVEAEAVRAGRWTSPSAIGFGVCFAVRVDWVRRLGGWDERLGAGTQPFPAAEDVDFNLRLLKAGGVAVASPSVRVVHEQWRDTSELAALLEGYAVAVAAVCGKLVRTGHAPDGAWLWARETEASLRLLASGLKRRSRLRVRVGARRLRGHVRGSVMGLARPW